MPPRNSRLSVTTRLEPPRSLSLSPGQSEEKRKKGFGLVAFDSRFEKYNTFGYNKRTIDGIIEIDW